MNDKIIEVRSESERRMHQRRREDQVRVIEQAADLLARERRWNLLQAAATVYQRAGFVPCSPDDPEVEPHLIGWCIDEAERLFTEIERREKERLADSKEKS